VFDKSVIDGSFAQANFCDVGIISYGLQPFAVTSGLASADGIRYDGAFSARAVVLNDGRYSQNVRAWEFGRLYISTAEDALNGTPTAYAFFNPLLATAANGQQFQELITTQIAPDGETLYTFSPVADLGASSNGDPYHQITETFGMDTTVMLQDNSTTTLGEFLTANVGQDLYFGSLINSGASAGIYEISAVLTPNTNAILFVFGFGGQELEAVFAHQISAVSDPVLVGDVNLDGDVTFADIPAFITVLSAGTFQDEADCDENGEVNFADIPAFIEILIG